MSDEIKDINLAEEFAKEPIQQEAPQEEPKYSVKFEEGGETLEATTIEEEKQVEATEPEKPVEDAVQQVQGEAEEGVLRNERVEETSSEEVLEKIEEPQEEEVKDISEPPLVEGVEKVSEETTTSVVEEQPEVETPELPEFIQKLYDFHKETGGDLNDFQRVNQDFDSMDDEALLKSYIQANNPGFTSEEVGWDYEDKYVIDEDYDEDSREYKKAVLNKKRDVTAAKEFFNTQKEKYVAELKSTPKDIPGEYKDAFNKVQEQKKFEAEQEALKADFMAKTDKVFSEDFTGFVFDTGEGKYRIKVNDVNTIKDQQVSLSNFSREFVDPNTQKMTDPEGYHRALWAAKNVDTIAKYFYNQGKAEAIKERAKVTKNIDMDQKTGSAKTNQGAPSVKFLDVDTNPWL